MGGACNLRETELAADRFLFLLLLRRSERASCSPVGAVTLVIIV